MSSNREEGGSDSSMDDCNGDYGSVARPDVLVQIPLWTIVTKAIAILPNIVTSSDSSMDDCNSALPRPAVPRSGVQIPLWTIVTHLRNGLLSHEYVFRFLYGRL